ncbi:MAG: 1,4-alpha-glucan branching protein GlgB [Clostridiales bacterium]|nr:1,4-alpha-glucan branching protein GlgB [Clostridiales bacterium]
MNETLNQLIDWQGVEAIVYSECDCPQKILGAHKIEAGTLVQTFIPDAKEVRLKVNKVNRKAASLAMNNLGLEYMMERIGEDDFFAVLIPKKSIGNYTYKVTYKDGNTQEIIDPYSFSTTIKQEDCEKFNRGIHYELYQVLGAHVCKIKGVLGTRFAVWAPNAMRVSVVGDFNQWDGRKHPMRRLGNSGIFELFLPGVEKGALYKYEIKAKGGLTFLKADPFAFYSELRPNTASIVSDSSDYEWKDSTWLTKRKHTSYSNNPMSIYEVHLGSFKKPEEKNGSFYNYRDLAVMLADYVKKMGYTHIELLPVMEHPLDASWGYQVTGYYSVTSRYGTPEDFKFFMDYMHQKGIGVILDWVPAHFPRDTYGLSNFDGTCLYEHKDPRKGSHPHWGTLIFNYGRPEVSNFLIANALFWLSEYHADGIRMDAVASMLYLDYGKNDGEWVANEYGGNENLEAMEMLKHLNSIVHKRKDGAIIIAEESTAWPMITGDLNYGGLGFDYKWNMGWMNDFTNYMKQDPLFRKSCHGALTFSMVYAYSERFILVLSHDEVVHGKCSMINKMPGYEEDKFANLRAAYGFMTAHPGKKLLFMGQEFAQKLEWNEDVSLSWNLLQEEKHQKMQLYVKDLNNLYKKRKALYELDEDPKGFEWISSMDADHSIISFVRKGKEERLVIVINFTPVVYEDFYLAVPYKGKYKEIFNSDNEKYGGTGHVNSRMKASIDKDVDGQAQAIRISLPPLGMAVFEYKGEKKTTVKKKKRFLQVKA